MLKNNQKKKSKSIKPKAYFKGSTRQRAGRAFAGLVFAVVRRIPKGETLTYGEVARRAGNFRAARAVGSILHTNYDPKIPCHRVVRIDGSFGGYNRGIKNKLKKLKAEKAIN